MIHLYLCDVCSVDLALLQCLCVLLETNSRPEAPEALRLACAEALGLSGATVVTSSLKGSPALKALSTRLVRQSCEMYRANHFHLSWINMVLNFLDLKDYI